MPDYNQIVTILSHSIRESGNWVIWFAHQPNGLLIEAGVGLFALLLCVVALNRLEMDAAQQPPPKAPTPLPLISTRGSKPRGTVYIPFELGPVTVDLQPKRDETIHVGIGGSSGLGKSTAVLSLLNLPLGVLILALDNTKPIAEFVRALPDGIEWTNEPNWPIGIDLLRGDPRIVSEVLVEGWSMRTTQDTGKWRRLARSRLWTALEVMDRLGIERTMDDLAKALMERTGNGEVDRACADWAGRLSGLTRSMGSSLGHDLDIVEAMRSRKKLLLRVNPFIDPLDAPMISGMLLVHARRAAQEAGVPFICIVEEAGQMANYQDEIIPLAQAARDRGVPLVVLTQNWSKLPVEVSNNISVWASFAQEDKREMAVAAHKLRLEADHLQRESFPGKGEQQGRGWCYIRAPGVPTRLVHVNLPKPIKIKELGRPLVIQDSPTKWEVVGVSGNLNGWHPNPPALTAPVRRSDDRKPYWVGTNPDLLRFYEQMRRTGRPTPLWSPSKGIYWVEDGCLEWHGPLSKAKGKETLGRPRSNIGRASVTVYVETKRATGESTDPSLDHNCDNPICCDPDHTEACTIPENNKRRRTRQVMLEKAWIGRYGEIPSWWQNRHHERVSA